MYEIRQNVTTWYPSFCTILYRGCGGMDRCPTRLANHPWKELAWEESHLVGWSPTGEGKESPSCWSGTYLTMLVNQLLGLRVGKCLSWVVNHPQGVRIGRCLTGFINHHQGVVEGSARGWGGYVSHWVYQLPPQGIEGFPLWWREGMCLT